MELTTEELNSNLWKKIKAHHEAKLQALRRLNDIHQPESDTQITRGKIAAHKELLRLDPDWKD